MFITIFLACAVNDNSSEFSQENAFDAVAEFEVQLVGRFTSEEQAAVHSNYWPVQLHSCIVSIPELGEHVLYVEQAMLDSVHSPYRQRIYHLEEIKTEEEYSVRSTIYSVSNEDDLIGLCNESEVASIDADLLVIREGCHVDLVWNGEGFDGSTDGTSCESSLNGSVYATSEVQTAPERIESWDRGWDAQDNQVWGAVDGAYIFDRK
ncbi:MAG: chromophore lyase CpcT/CpeT [Myxococcota bacterium]|nr:chromophore lyase CpcT/CpeT [Myxococcota bacterium]